ncbi:MAG: hypothetical protein MJZ07_08005 [Bacteroidales bacterium]|nr:hypothetical protein [Bacteroidales bacterium]
MKIKFLLLTLIVLFTCCSKENSRLNSCDESEQLETFASMLSSAVYNEPELRSFLKNEALLKVDYDYDVVYSLSKNKLVRGSCSMEDILKKYDYNGEFDKIVSDHPLLTILIPDWTWVCEACFSPEKWDTSCPCVGVSCSDGKELHNVYCDGKVAFTLCGGEFTDTPLLIVKDNDRLSQINTKSTLSSPVFFCDDFCDIAKTVQTKANAASSVYTDYNLPYECASDSISISLIDNALLNAYAIGVNNPQVEHRDHIYYGMTPAKDSGCVNNHYYEHLAKIKLSPSALGLFDDPVGGSTMGTDYVFNSYHYLAHGAGKAPSLSIEELMTKIWGEGALEIVVKVYAGLGNVIRKGVSVPFASTFSVKKVRLRENYNRLGYLMSRTYYLDVNVYDGSITDWLEPKWINIDQDLFCWNIVDKPTSYIVEFLEHDDGTSTTITRTESFSWMTNYSYSIDSTEGTIKYGYGTGVSLTESQSCTYTEVIVQQDDDLMNFVVNYSDNVILGTGNGMVKMKTYHTGYVDAMIYPRHE